jgi:hippurate hydrolase
MSGRIVAIAAMLFLSFCANASELKDAVKKDYDDYLWPLFDHFHRNPELSTIEHKTAARMAEELDRAGFEVTEGVGGTGVVAMLENGDGPLVMMRADMDGLPVEEKSGLENASRMQQIDPITGNQVFTMHACGHDVHITSLVGTARQMANRKDEWSGTLMLIVQPAEERVLGAAAMKADGIWDQFGKPDYALAFHVNALDVAGKVNVTEGSPFAGADTVDIIIQDTRCSRIATALARRGDGRIIPCRYEAQHHLRSRAPAADRQEYQPGNQGDPSERNHPDRRKHGTCRRTAR